MKNLKSEDFSRKKNKNKITDVSHWFAQKKKKKKRSQKVAIQKNKN